MPRRGTRKLDRSPMDLLEDALIDAESTSRALDAVSIHMSAEEDKQICMDVLTRHLQADLAKVRDAYRALHAGRKRKQPAKGGANNLAIVGGTDDHAA